MKLITSSIQTLEEAKRVLYNTTATEWAQAETICLKKELLSAKEVDFYKKHDLPSDQEINEDPQEAILSFPTLSKLTYLQNQERLKRKGFPQKGVHTFFTSGTTYGKKSEIPWDPWTYYKGFIETSIFGMAMAGLSKDDNAVCLANSAGALGVAYTQAAKQTRISLYIPNQQGLHDKEPLSNLYQYMVKNETDLLIGAPGVLYALTEAMLKAKMDIEAIPLKAIISGIGNFLTPRHIEYFSTHWNVARIIEQGGKNEIHHAPGAIRYNRDHPEQVCLPGYMHYSPTAMYGTVVDDKLVRLDDDTRGILLMTRLSSGKKGVVSYINDACDYGKVMKYKDSTCPCGCSMPMFAFKGRVDGSPILKFGANIFPAEVTEALSAASHDLSLDSSIAADLRAQVILIRHPQESQPDSLYWIVGTPSIDIPSTEMEKIRLITKNLFSYSGYLNKILSKTQERYVLLKKGVIVNNTLLPHTGRDKPAYQIVLEIKQTPHPSPEIAFKHYMEKLREDLT